MDFDTSFHYYTTKEDFFLPFFFLVFFFHFDVSVYFLSLVNAIGKGVILAQIFALGCVYILYLAQTQGNDIIYYLGNLKKSKNINYATLHYFWVLQIQGRSLSLSAYCKPVWFCWEPGPGHLVTLAKIHNTNRRELEALISK